MTDTYNPQAIEAKWRKAWSESGLASVEMDPSKPKYYCLDMFPYPSGEGLHVGHWRGYVLSDTWSRYQMMQGKQVLHPMGWDAFGLPAENRAIKQGIHPEESTQIAIENMKRQLGEISAVYDWNREVNTSSPEYYKWTQWLFLKLYEMGLAYRKEAEVNWCPQDQTVLANEQVVDGKCERCGTEVTKKSLKQWFFKITDYAEELLDFSGINWPERTKTMQKNWIGKSEGAQLFFKVADSDDEIEIFTTRPETIFGASFLVLAPEHPLVEGLAIDSQRQEIDAYRDAAKKKAEIERTATNKEKTGVFTGSYAINPVNNEKVPIWIADYVLSTYGTGAIMAVPAHDERDFDLAKKYDLPIIPVIDTKGADLPYIEKGEMADGEWMGKTVDQFIDVLLERVGGKKQTTYRLRDWLVSRQRYWGAPIPIIYCDSCGEVPLSEDQLPVILPHQVDFQPGGESPLARDDQFVNTSCPKCQGSAKRETDTMDTFVDSSWYFLRYTDPKNSDRIFDPNKVEYWMAVDMYVGGIEHAILHLLYARFMTKAIADAGFVHFREPFNRLFNNGMIYLNGKKMSKSKGNIVNPDELVSRYGADTLRGYEIFIAPPEQDVEWNPNGVAGVYRFLHKAWEATTGELQVGEMRAATHQLIKKVTNDLESFSLNTIVSSLMSYVNDYGSAMNTEDAKSFVKLMAPIFPHFAEEVWSLLGNTETVFHADWPKYEEAKLLSDTVKLIVQIGGKTKGTIDVPAQTDEEAAKALIEADDNLHKYVSGQNIKKVVFVPGRLINFVLE